MGRVQQVANEVQKMKDRQIRETKGTKRKEKKGEKLNYFKPLPVIHIK
jgi:hypothetical protein